jgi:energy-coupling factor transporter ATP-binding protein EcfA2
VKFVDCFLSWISGFVCVYFTMAENASNLQLSPGKRILILGPSGCGKSSLLKKIAGFDPPFPVDVPSAENTALLLQNPFHQIIMRRVRDELYFPLRNAGIPEDVAAAKIEEITDILGIGHLMEREIATLSFGETQLLMIAATFLTPADIYLLDEPSSHLDPPLIRRFYTLVEQLARQNKSVCITSQISDEYRYCDEICLMEKGRIVQVLTSAEFGDRHRDFGICCESELILTRLWEIREQQ